MRNKKIFSFFYIVFSLLFINQVLSEEIIFETPEIETFDNGNILKANKGGKAVVDINTQIIADRFEYNKTTNILSAHGNVEVFDNLNNVKTESNKITYLKNQEKYFSEGKTKIYVEDKYIINSKNVHLLINKKQIFSDENTVLVDTKNNYYEAEKFKYSIDKKLFRGSNVTLTNSNKDKYFFEDLFSNLKTDELHGKDLEVDFNNEMFGNSENEPRLKGIKSYSNKNITTVSKGVFTTCKKRKDKCPPWKVEANEVKHDKNKKTIYYKNAWLKIYDVPVLYYPYFFHPDPTVERQSGFLTPQIGDSQTLGSSAYIPYFYVISDKKDLTLKPRIFTDNKFSIQTEYRRVTNKANHIFDVSLTHGHSSSSSDNEDSRSHIFTNSIMDIDLNSFDNSNLEIQLQKTSNDTYLRLFNLESPLFGSSGSKGISTLNSFLNLTANKEDLGLNVSTRVYEKLDTSNSDRYEFIFPSYSLSKNIRHNNKLDGSLSFNSSGSQHIYNTNVKESHIINDLLFNSQDKFLTSGIKNNYNILIKNVNSEGTNSTKYKNTLESELLSTIMFESSYPLLREGMNFNNYLTPKISLRYSPNNMKNLKNEDRRIDINNIFSLNRLGFSDSVESGQSLTIGSEFKKSRIILDNKDLPIEKDFFEASFATVFRDEINDDMPTSSSLGKTSSDVVGKIMFTPNNFLSSGYQFSLDNNIDQIKYHDLNAKFTVNNFVTSFKYIEEKDNIGNEHYLSNTTSYKLDENNSFSFSTRKNKKIDMTEFYDLIYQYKNDCLTAAVKYNKEYYADSDIKPTEQLFFSLTIVPLGAYESKNVLSKK